ncbi:MAG: hypothetical protein JWN78_1168 [Bacteroidota bacterium]|nr:hypothetical protein [Bacteroidota bacterium]
MQKTALALILMFQIFSIYAKDANNIKVFLKDGTVLSGITENVKENSILLLKALDVNKKKYALNAVDSFIVNNDIYTILSYHDTLYIARPLFKGDVEAYKIISGEPLLLIKKSGEKEKFMEITEKNKYGMYNYLFKECLTKDSSIVKKRTNSINDYVLTNEVVKRLNCNKTPYTVYKKYPKTGIYIGVIGGISMLKPLIKSKEKNYLANSKKHPNVGYFTGIALLLNFKKNFDLITDIDYSSNKSTFTYEQTFTSPITYTSTYAGTIQSKAINLNINFRYRFLKTKISPFILLGIRYSHKLYNKEENTYTNNFGGSTVKNSSQLNNTAFGVNIGAGVNYNITSRISMHLNVGYSYCFGIKGPEVLNTTTFIQYSIKEGDLRAEVGLSIRLNKL